MHTQFLLPGFEAGRTPTDRLFFAVLPDPDTAARILRAGEALRGACALRAALHDPRRLHVTLQHLGNHAGRPRALIDAACRAAERVRFPCFDVEFDRALTFTGRARVPGRRPFVLLPARGAESLCALDAALAAALRREAVDARAWKFTPHVTLSYDQCIVAGREIEPIYWRVRDFALIRSRIGAGRPYEILGRFALFAPSGVASATAAEEERVECLATRSAAGR